MRRFAGFAVFAVGIVLVVWGANASQSASSDISRFFTGAATNKALYLIVGGAVAVIAGASMAFSRRRKQA
jgi:LPXTG-motif cell wall-anchored protein